MNEIIIVSGLPRSGTSLMMQMLASGGVAIVTDNQRAADADNPRGYCEFESVKKIKHDSSWLPETRGKAVKIVSKLLYDLPPTERYRIIFMERDLDEVLASQEKMLERLGQKSAPRAPMKQAFLLHLEKLHDWLRQQPHMEVLRVNYNELMKRSAEQAERVAAFLGGHVNAVSMATVVDASLYRNKKT